MDAKNVKLAAQQPAEEAPEVAERAKKHRADGAVVAAARVKGRRAHGPPL